MMRRLILILLFLSLLMSSALADPFVLGDDWAEDIVELYDEEDPSAGTFRYSYRYPHIDESDEEGDGINEFYDYLISNELSFYIEMARDSFVEGVDSTTVITYTVTCNNDDYFSVLIRKEENTSDRTGTFWEGHVFLRNDPNPGFTNTLPQYLGILDAAETDEWLQERQTGRADDLIREMVWEMIEENEAGIEYSAGFTEEKLSRVFFPEEDFYLDENGDTVFFLQPGDVYDEVPEGADLITFPISREDILDEL